MQIRNWSRCVGVKKAAELHVLEGSAETGGSCGIVSRAYRAAVFSNLRFPAH